MRSQPLSPRQELESLVRELDRIRLDHWEELDEHADLQHDLGVLAAAFHTAMNRMGWPLRPVVVELPDEKLPPAA